MEKLDKSRSKDYGPLVIWANDLFDIFSELKDCNRIELVADDTKFDSIEEFIQINRGQKPSVVKITIHEPYLTIDLYPRWARLYVSSSQLIPSGLFLKVDSILSRCERKPHFFFNHNLSFGSVVIIPSLFYLPLFKPIAYLQIWTYILLFIWMFYLMYIRLWKFSTVHTVFQEDRPSFLKRNADTIIIAVISVLIGAIFGVAVTKLADRMWPNNTNNTIDNNISQKK